MESIQSINTRTRKDGKKGERERYGVSFRYRIDSCACSRNRWIQGRRVTDNRLQRVYFFQGRARYKMDETKASMEARSRPIDSAISFAFLVFRFSPAAAAFARGGTQLRYTMGQFARTKFNFLRPIDFFFSLLPFSLSF